MMSIMMCSSMRHVLLINAVQSSASEQAPSSLDPGYDMTKPRSFLGHRGSQDVLVEVLRRSPKTPPAIPTHVRSLTTTLPLFGSYYWWRSPANPTLHGR